jgi:transposase
MDERVKFVAEVLKGERKITDLCEHYGISRKTGYKWIKRYEEAGPVGLEDLGRRPLSCAHATPDVIVKQILELRYKHPTWGARKLQAKLEQARSDTKWPVASTINAILQRAGLVQTQKPKRRVTHPCRHWERSRRRISYGAWTSRAFSDAAIKTDVIHLRSQMHIAATSSVARLCPS